MRSEKQRETSRINGKKSRGPITPTGKNISKFNGLKHGLRADQVVLPGEDPAEFRAELAGWAGDWRPNGHTGAVLVERAAVASWRLRRCVRAEKGLLLEVAARGEDGDDDRIDAALERRLGRADGDLPFEPAPSLAVLKAAPAGVDRLIARWDGLDEALGDDGDDWDRDAHRDLLPLLGHDADAEAAGPLAGDSLRLVLDHEHYDEAGVNRALEDDDRSATVARVRRGIERETGSLRSLRSELLAAPAPRVEQAEAAKFSGVTSELMLMHRYEMAHERSLRAAIKDLVALEKARPRSGDIEAQAVTDKVVKKNESAPPARPDPGVAAAPSEPEAGADVVASGGPRGDLGGLPRRRRRRKGRRSAR